MFKSGFQRYESVYPCKGGGRGNRMSFIVGLSAAEFENISSPAENRAPRPSHVTFLLRCILISFCFFLPFHAFADTTRWEPYPPGTGGPWGGKIRKIQIPDPMGQILWAATSGGAHYSADGGLTWENRSSGLPTLNVMSLDAQGGRVLAFIEYPVEYRGLYQSDNGGLLWEKAALFRVSNEQLESFPCIRDILLDPANPDHAFLYYEQGDCEGSDYRSPGGLVEANLDQASTEPSWEIVWEKVEKTTFVADMHFLNGGDLIWANSDGSIYEYFQGDDIPVELLTDLKSNCDNDNKYDVVVDFVVLDANEQIYAAACGTAGLFISFKDGEGNIKWAERHFSSVGYEEAAFDVIVNQLAADPSNANRLVYAVHHITDTATYLFEIEDVSIDPDYKCVIENGKMKNCDMAFEKGQYWDIINPAYRMAGKPKIINLPEKGMEILDVQLSDGAEYFGESEAGVFMRTRGEDDFVHSSKGIAAFAVKDIAFSPRADGSFVVTGGGSVELGNGGVYFWDAQALSWRRSSGWHVGASTDLAGYRGEEVWVTATGGADGSGFYSSVDNGLSWQYRNNKMGEIGDSAKKSICEFTFSTSDNKAAIAGTSSGFYLSADGGNTWAVDSDYISFGRWLVAEDIARPRSFFAASGNSLYSVSHAGGAVWDVQLELEDGVCSGCVVSSMAASSRIGGHLLIGTGGSGVYERVSPTEGVRLLSQVPAGNVSAVAVADREGDPWMAASVDQKGIYVVKDGSSNWLKITEGLESSNGDVPLINVLAFDPLSPRLIAGVENRGLFFLDFGEAAGFEPYPWSVEDINSESGGLTADIAVSAQEIIQGAEMRFSSDGFDWSAWLPLAEKQTVPLSSKIRTSEVLFVQFKDENGNASIVVEKDVKDILPPPPPGSSKGGGGGGGGCFVSLLADFLDASPSR